MAKAAILMPYPDLKDIFDALIHNYPRLTPMTVEYVQTDLIAEKAVRLEQEGCELICVCGSGPEFIGPESAAQFGGKVITADINQLDSSDSIIAASGINHINVVQLALKDLEEGKLKGGQKNFFGLSQGGVSLQMKEGQFQNFGDAELAALSEQITDGEIEIEDADVAENPERYEITVCSLIGVEDALAKAEAEENAAAGESDGASETDAGSDSGSDSGSDAGLDSGTNSGAEAGVENE